MEDLKRILDTLAPGEGPVLQKGLVEGDSEETGG
jgi:ParB family chromosome partitioning protein